MSLFSGNPDMGPKDSHKYGSSWKEGSLPVGALKAPRWAEKPLTDGEAERDEGEGIRVPSSAAVANIVSFGRLSRCCPWHTL